MTSEVRVRFAPSPTGFLHVGGARTALFNFLYARRYNGKFLLRIEDTDRERSLPHFTEDILNSLKWLNLNWDEEPLYQSTRFPHYQGLAKKLLEEGKAYYCHCTPEELDKVRAQYEKMKKPFRYPGTCRDKGLGHAPGAVLRIKNPKSGTTTFNDLVRGEITYNHTDLDDWVMFRADNTPTYNFCVVVDDHEQGITHILRGDDHINNTPKQILLYQALGYSPPNFAHLPMILGPDRTKLSKRHGAASTLEYRKMGYLPDALTNFIVRLGWSYGDHEIISRKEMIENFGLDHIGKAPAVFNVDKLNWLNGHYLKEADFKTLEEALKAVDSADSSHVPFSDPKLLKEIFALLQGKVKTLSEMVEQMKCLVGPDPSHDLQNLESTKKVEMKVLLKEMAPLLSSTDPFDTANIETQIKNLAASRSMKPIPINQALRFAVTGGGVGPSLLEMLSLLGKQVVVRRIEKAIEVL